MTRFSASALVGAMIAFGAGPALAADMVVLTTTSAAFKAGQVLPLDAKLGLASGQELTLMTPTGRVIKISGPADAIPTDGAALDDKTVLASLAGMVKSRQADTSSLGTFRASEAELPDPWLVDVSRAGERCIQAGEPLVLWRPDGAASVAVTLTLPAKTWRAQADWPEGSQRLLGPENMAFTDGETLSVDMNSHQTDMTIHLIPAEAQTDSKRLALLVGRNCMAQAEALVRQLE